MRRAFRVLSHGDYGPERICDSVLLDFDLRNRRRIVLRTESGDELLLDLPEVARLRDRDALVLNDGSLVLVHAKSEPLLEVSADSHTLMRTAWHLGNRHIPVQFTDGALRIRNDHVLSGMVKRLGATVHPIDAPFDPEGGAYESGASHAHDPDFATGFP